MPASWFRSKTAGGRTRFSVISASCPRPKLSSTVIDRNLAHDLATGVTAGSRPIRTMRRARRASVKNPRAFALPSTSSEPIRRRFHFATARPPEDSAPIQCTVEDFSLRTCATVTLLRGISRSIGPIFKGCPIPFRKSVAAGITTALPGSFRGSGGPTRPPDRHSPPGNSDRPAASRRLPWPCG